MVATLFYQNEPGTPSFFGLKSPTNSLLFGVLQEAPLFDYYASEALGKRVYKERVYSGEWPIDPA
jgi:hypothetical protein